MMCVGCRRRGRANMCVCVEPGRVGLVCMRLVNGIRLKDIVCVYPDVGNFSTATCGVCVCVYVSERRFNDGLLFQKHRRTVYGSVSMDAV